MKTIKLQDKTIGEGSPLCFISGPCAIEDEDHTLFCAEALCKIAEKYPVTFIFKGSYDKANRSSIHSFRGVGKEKGLKILEKVKKTFHVPVLSDIHHPEEADFAKDMLDIIQIPAFLSRQTDLLISAAKTQKPLMVKKGQFLSPWDMKNVVDKIESAGNSDILLVDRGTSFGYNNLVSDMRSIPVMQGFGHPVCYDGSHSVMLPGGLGHQSGGQREFIPTLSKAAVAAGANALYIESHPEPARAKSDASTVMPYDALDAMLQEVLAIYEVMQCVKTP